MTFEEHSAAVATARTEGASAERLRIRSILTCEAAKGREPMARSLAIETSMSAEEAARVLASLQASSAA